MQFDEFLSVVDLLQNTTKYSSRIEELKKQEQAIKDATEQLNVVGEIAKVKQQTAKLNEQAKAALQTAQDTATKIVADAQVVFDKRHADLKAREIVAEQAITDYNAIKASQIARDEAFRLKEKETTNLRASLQAQLDAVAVKQLDVDERLAKLRSAMG